jgi:hypothetical protein
MNMDIIIRKDVFHKHFVGQTILEKLNRIPVEDKQSHDLTNLGNASPGIYRIWLPESAGVIHTVCEVEIKADHRGYVSWPDGSIYQTAAEHPTPKQAPRLSAPKDVEKGEEVPEEKEEEEEDDVAPVSEDAELKPKDVCQWCRDLETYPKGEWKRSNKGKCSSCKKGPRQLYYVPG